MCVAGGWSPLGTWMLVGGAAESRVGGGEEGCPGAGWNGPSSSILVWYLVKEAVGDPLAFSQGTQFP